MNEMNEWMTEHQAQEQAERIEAARRHMVDQNSRVAVYENHETDGYHVEVANSYSRDALYSPDDVDDYLAAIAADER